MEGKIPLNVLKEFWCLSLWPHGKLPNENQSLITILTLLGTSLLGKLRRVLLNVSSFRLALGCPYYLPQPSLCAHLFSATTLNHLCVKLHASNELQYQYKQFSRTDAIRGFFHSLEHRHLTKNEFPYFFLVSSAMGFFLRQEQYFSTIFYFCRKTNKPFYFCFSHSLYHEQTGNFDMSFSLQSTHAPS